MRRQNATASASSEKLIRLVSTIVAVIEACEDLSHDAFLTK